MPNPKTKRFLASLSAAAIIPALALTACGPSDDAVADPAHSMYTWISNENDRKQWQAFVDAAQEENPDFELAMEGPSFADYWTKVKTRLSSDGAPCILTTQAARAQELEALLAPLDELIAANDLDIGKYNEAMVEGMTVDGTVRAIPYDAEPMVLYYNEDLFAAAGLDAPSLNYTTEQFVADARALTRDGKLGLAITPTGQPIAMAFANGHPPTKDGELAITDQGFVESVQFSFDLVVEEKIAKAPSSADGAAASQQEFMSGEAAMIIDGPWMHGSYVEGTEGEVGLAVIPSRDGEAIGEIQGSGFGIAETCEDKEEAFKTIMEITTPEVIGAVGARQGTIPSLEESMPAWAEGKDPQDVEVVNTLLENGKPLITTKTWNQFDSLFSQYIGDGYRGNKSAQEILTTIDASVG